jgi:hypothetical protein
VRIRGATKEKYGACDVTIIRVIRSAGCMLAGPVYLGSRPQTNNQVMSYAAVIRKCAGLVSGPLATFGDESVPTSSELGIELS